MSQHVLPGEPPVEITLRRTARARRFSLRVSRLDGRVTLSMPARAKEREALAFAAEKAEWVRRMLRDAAGRETVVAGGEIRFEGRALRIAEAQVRAARVEGDRLVVPAGADRVAPRVLAFLKLAARQRLLTASESHAVALGRRFSRITLRDTRSRWGSCTADGRLMYSWRLIMAPPEVLDYVAAHEVAHLVEMNHSPAFWAVVEGLMPDYSRHRRWLRTHGPALHRVDFGG